MSAWWQRWRKPASTRPVPHSPSTERPADGQLEFDGERLDLAHGAHWHEGLPHPDFARARRWAEGFDDTRYGAAWHALQHAWLAWLALHAGDGYRVHASDDALLLTRAEPRAVALALDYLTLTARRVSRSLAGLAHDRLAEKQVVLLLDADDDYYRYLSGMYPDEGEFPMSAGVHFNGPAPHFVVNGTELSEVEATIVHEMTHAFVAHLPIPAWLNEGLAMNMEIAFGRVADAHRLIDLEQRHRRFWTPEAIQEYWSGSIWHRADDGNELAYDLGRLMVAGMSEPWARFEAFALAADLRDAGAAAAARHLGIDLGEFVRHYLERDDGDWSPQPQRWHSAPERGGFAPHRGQRAAPAPAPARRAGGAACIRRQA